MVHTPFVGQACPLLPIARQPAQHHAPMVSYMTADLKEEINRHRGREDSRTAIERLCKMHRDIEGRNLEKDFDLHAPVRGGLVAHAPLPPNSPSISGGGGGVHGACLRPAYGGLAA
jgi:hypothetical protein